MADASGAAARIGELLAKEAIREALYAGLDAVRRRDWQAARAGFAPAARADYGLGGAPTPEAQLAALARALAPFASSALLASNCEIELSRDGAARSSALVLAAHAPPAGSGARSPLAALRLADEWALGEDDRWRLSARRVEVLWRAWLDPRDGDREGDHRHAREW